MSDQIKQHEQILARYKNREKMYQVTARYNKLACNCGIESLMISLLLRCRVRKKVT